MENPPGDLGILQLKEQLQGILQFSLRSSSRGIGGGNLGILELKEQLQGHQGWKILLEIWEFFG